MRHIQRNIFRGFTLIELLVVITIIITLLAILLPSMGRAMEIADRAVCAARQNQLQVGFVSFATDRIGQLPNILPVDSGAHMLWCWNNPVADTLRNDYLGGKWEVMIDVTDRYSGEGQWEFPAQTFRLSGYIAMSHPWLEPGVRTDVFNTYGKDLSVMRMSDPSDRLLLADPLYHTPPYDTGNVWAWRWNIAAYGYHRARSEGEDGTNAAGGNQTSLDGSTRWVDFKDMELRIFQVRFGQSRAYWW